MAKAWSRAEEQHLLDVIPEYRKSILNKETKDARTITKKVAERLHKQHPILQGRTVTAIYERLPYLDNLLAGVFERTHYAIKDRQLYGTLPKENRDPNMCNSRHAYAGAVREVPVRKKR